MTTFDLSSTDMWWPQTDHDGLVTVERNRFPAMEAASSKEYNRANSHRTFRLPVRVRMAFDWIDGDIGGSNRQNLGVVVRFAQDEEHGYYVSLRTSGRFGISQEQVGYDGLGATVHTARPGDGLRHQLDVTFGQDRIRAVLDGAQVHEVARSGTFTPLEIGRIGLRLDRQHVIIPSLVVEELLPAASD